MKVVIVEDELIVADHLAIIAKSQNLDVVNIASTYAEAIDSLKEMVDLYFVDIRLKDGGSGLSFGAKLKELGIPFIYISANSELEIVQEAVQTEPQQYITKPFKEKDIIAAIQLLKLKFSNKIYVSVMTNKGKERILANDILYCKADNVYVIISTLNKNISIRSTLSSLEEQLPDKFLRTHRSFIVNKEKVSAIKPQSVFIGNVEIPLSKTYRRQFE